ncbi:Rne/Rng family ribonuclease [Buchananella felis]|uniref:Rne/Rng family ribonuclease n=1 Tax=Buchananella felis TaxID=3231492 RepID=UPI00352732F4
MAESRTRKPRRLSVPTTDPATTEAPVVEPAAEEAVKPKRATRSRKKVADVAADAPAVEGSAEVAAEPAAEEAVKPKRTTRSRKKVAADAPVEAPAEVAAEGAAEAPAVEPAAEEAVKPKRATRSRKKVAADAPVEAPAEAAAEGATEAPAVEPAAEEAVKPKRATRSRKKVAEPVADAPTVEAAAEVVAEPVAEEAVKPKRATRSRKKVAEPVADAPTVEAAAEVVAEPVAEEAVKPKRATRSRKKVAEDVPVEAAVEAAVEPAAAQEQQAPDQPAPAAKDGEAAPARSRRGTRSRRKFSTTALDPAAQKEAQEAAAEAGAEVEEAAVVDPELAADLLTEDQEAEAELAEGEEPEADTEEADEDAEQALPAAALLFQAPDLSATRRRTRKRAAAPVEEEDAQAASSTEDEESGEVEGQAGEENGEETSGRSRRRRGSRGRRGRARRSEEGEDGGDSGEDIAEQPAEEAAPAGEAEESGEESSSRRRRRRRTREDSGRDEITALKGSTRLEAKRQRRKEGRQAGRKRQLITESEFLARRESVNRHMIVRERDGLNQIAVLEDGLLVEHYVARRTQSSMVGAVVLGRVQNVLPTMEAAFVDIGQGRNAVLYAGEVNWDLVDAEGKPRKIEEAIKAGDQVLVQVTKDPIGHKGARLTSQISLAGRFLVLVPGSGMTGISRKLPVGERTRLKTILKEVVPDGAGVIVRTAAEGATDEQLREDVARLQEQWEEIQAKQKKARNVPQVLRGEPELAVRVVRDIFNEDFAKLTVSGDNAWKTISSYVQEMSPDLMERLEHFEGDGDVFAAFRVDEQLAKGMDRKVWLPSGGSLIIDRTEAMTVVDVNTGRFTGSGTLEETVTRNNLEAAEEIVRQLRLRDIGGIIVIDFVDMVLSQNRDLVLRRLVECLGRDRTRHQVTEVTSLGLVQMTRKRVGEGLVEAFSTQCECCAGRGFIVQGAPVESSEREDDERGSRRRGERHREDRNREDRRSERGERGERAERSERGERRRKEERSGNTAGEARTRRARVEEAHVVAPDRTEMRERMARIALAAAQAHEESDAAANAAEVATGRPETAVSAAAPVVASEVAAQAAQEKTGPAATISVSLSQPVSMRGTRRRRRGLSTGVLDPSAAEQAQAAEQPKVEIELPPVQEPAPAEPKREVEIELPQREEGVEAGGAKPKTRRRVLRKKKD